MDSKPLRLDQLLSRYGYCSRREATQWLRAGRVTRKGDRLEDPETRVVATEVCVDGNPIEAAAGLLVMLHKPAGYVCSRDVREGPSVYDLLPTRWSERHPPVTTVGRLDRDTTGLLLVTDVGELVHRWTSPRHHVEKTYAVTVEGSLRPEMATLLQAGTLRLPDEERPCLPARLEIQSANRAALTLVEGRYHQVRRMFAALGLRVVGLHRHRFGEYELGDLPEGKWRWLNLPCFE